MREKKPITVRIGSRGQRITEPAKDVIFTYSDIPGGWHILENDGTYVLCSDTGKYLTFVEFFHGGQDSLTFYKGREWERRHRDDNDYVLIRPKKYHGTKMPLTFVQYIRNAIRDAKEIDG